MADQSCQHCCSFLRQPWCSTPARVLLLAELPSPCSAGSPRQIRRHHPKKKINNLPAFTRAHPGDQRPVPSAIPPRAAADPQLTPVCGSSGKRAPRSFSGDDPTCRELPWVWSLRGGRGFFQRQAGSKRRSESLDFCHSIASAQSNLSKC